MEWHPTWRMPSLHYIKHATRVAPVSNERKPSTANFLSFGPYSGAARDTVQWGDPMLAFTKCNHLWRVCALHICASMAKRPHRFRCTGNKFSWRSVHPRQRPDTVQWGDHELAFTKCNQTRRVCLPMCCAHTDRGWCAATVSTLSFSRLRPPKSGFVDLTVWARPCTSRYNFSRGFQRYAYLVPKRPGSASKVGRKSKNE